MKFKMSSDVSLQTEKKEQAFIFYNQILGLPALGAETQNAIDASPLTLYIDNSGYCHGLLMELLVDNVETAKTYLQKHGCKILHWQGAGKACIIEDPFGVKYNLWQD